MHADGPDDTHDAAASGSTEAPRDEVLCESCARPDPDIAPVRRMYVVPAAWDTEGSETVVDEPEAWCFSCRTMYPHQPLPS